MSAFSRLSVAHFLGSVYEFADRTTSFFIPLAKFAAVALLLTTIFDLVTRRFFVLGSTRLQEFEWHMHVVLFSMCLGYAYIKDRHVRIDLFHGNFSNKTKNIVEILGVIFLVIPYLTLIIYFSLQFFWQSFVIDEAAKAALGIPHRWIIKFFLPLGFALLFIAAVGVLSRSVANLLDPASETIRNGESPLQ